MRYQFTRATRFPQNIPNLKFGPVVVKEIF